jgi:hypothetical protein
MWCMGVELDLITDTGWQNGRSRSETRKGLNGHNGHMAGRLCPVPEKVRQRLGIQGIRPILANKLRHAPATGFLTSGFTMNGTGSSVPNPPSRLAIGDNAPETAANKVEASQVRAGLMPHVARHRTVWVTVAMFGARLRVATWDSVTGRRSVGSGSRMGLAAPRSRPRF